MRNFHKIQNEIENYLRQEEEYSDLVSCENYKAADQLDVKIMRQFDVIKNILKTTHMNTVEFINIYSENKSKAMTLFQKQYGVLENA